MERESKFFKEINTLDAEDFFSSANNFLGLSKNKIDPQVKLLMEWGIHNPHWDLLVDNDKNTGSKTLHFFSEEKNRVVFFTFDNLAQELAEFFYTPKFLKQLYGGINHYAITKARDEEMDKKLKLLDSAISFNGNHTIYYDDESNKLELTTDKVPYNILLDYDLDIKKHKKLNPNLDKYFLSLTGEDEELKEYLLNALSTIFLPNKIIEKVFWVFGEGGIGKSELMKYITHLIGDEHTSAVPIKDFLDGNDKVYTRRPLATSILNIDDDFSKHTIKNTGWMKSYISGKLKVNIEIKHKEPIAFIGKAKIFILTNEIPNFKNLDSGDRRRNVIIPLFREDYNFDYSILNDPMIKENLISNLTIRALKMSRGKVSLDNKPQKIIEIESFITDIKEDIINLIKGHNYYNLTGKDGSLKILYFSEGKMYLSTTRLLDELKTYYSEIGKNSNDLNVKDVISSSKKNLWILGNVKKIRVGDRHQIRGWEITRQFLKDTEVKGGIEKWDEIEEERKFNNER